MIPKEIRKFLCKLKAKDGGIKICNPKTRPCFGVTNENFGK
jgi:hypothetical protein